MPELVYPSSFDWPGFSRTSYHPDYAAIGRRVDTFERIYLLTGATRDEPRREELELLRATLSDRCGVKIAPYDDPPAFTYARCD